MAKGYSYIITRDYGFAPNPFGGVCTLATCKPKIRKGLDANEIYSEFENNFSTSSEIINMFEFISDTPNNMEVIGENDIHNDKTSVHTLIKQSYIYYLLDIIALYLNREKGNFNKDVAKNITIWVSLLEKLAQ